MRSGWTTEYVCLRILNYDDDYHNKRPTDNQISPDLTDWLKKNGKSQFSILRFIEKLTV